MTSLNDNKKHFKVINTTNSMITYVGSKNPAKLTSVLRGLSEYHPNDSFDIVTHKTISVPSPIPNQKDIIVLEKQGQSVFSFSPETDITKTSTSVPVKHIIIGVEVDSGVSPQPFSAQETLTGANNRSKALQTIIQDTQNYLDLCKQHDICPHENVLTDQFLLQYTFTVGIEGGIEHLEDIYLESGYIVVHDSFGTRNVGTSARFEIAQHIIDRIEQKHEELSVIVDDIAKGNDLRSSSGFMGVITQNLLTRIRAYKHGVLFAFAKWESPNEWWYKE